MVAGSDCGCIGRLKMPGLICARVAGTQDAKAAQRILVLL